MVDTGALVAPCACRGSGQFVHLACLRQWQKSVLLTQSTHPLYQTRIDEVCNVCRAPYDTRVMAEAGFKSRRQCFLEYTGGEIAQMMRPGSFIVSSRQKSDANCEYLEEHPEIAEQIKHFTNAVYWVTRVTQVWPAAHARCHTHCKLTALAAPPPLTHSLALAGQGRRTKRARGRAAEGGGSDSGEGEGSVVAVNLTRPTAAAAEGGNLQPQPRARYALPGLAARITRPQAVWQQGGYQRTVEAAVREGWLRNAAGDAGSGAHPPGTVGVGHFAAHV